MTNDTPTRPVRITTRYQKGPTDVKAKNAPPWVTLNQIFNGMYPFLTIQLLTLLLTWYWPEMTLWLPRYLYGEGTLPAAARSAADKTGQIGQYWF